MWSGESGTHVYSLTPPLDEDGIFSLHRKPPSAYAVFDKFTLASPDGEASLMMCFPSGSSSNPLPVMSLPLKQPTCFEDALEYSNHEGI